VLTPCSLSSAEPLNLLALELSEEPSYFTRNSFFYKAGTREGRERRRSFIRRMLAAEARKCFPLTPVLIAER
jgi:hypothetical protein